jgi:hypothetical protein
MTAEQIKEGNELIANSKYSGWVNLTAARPDILRNPNKPIYQIGVWQEKYDTIKGIYKSPLDPAYAVTDQLNFHESWEALMPVIITLAKEYDIRLVWFEEKCITTIAKQTFTGDEVAEYGGYNPDIMNPWRAVVKLLKTIKT